jgi:hypothetical protein
LHICEEGLRLVAVKIVRWLIFGAIISLLPLAFTFGDLALRGRPHHLVDVIGSGELLVVVWVLSASALGEMFGGSSGHPVLRIVTGGLTLLVIVLSAMLYALVAEAKAGGQPIDEELLVNASMILYVGSLIPCVFCLICSEIEP